MELIVWQVFFKLIVNFLENIRVFNFFYRIYFFTFVVESCIIFFEKVIVYLEMVVQGVKINYGEKNIVKGLYGVQF